MQVVIVLNLVITIYLQIVNREDVSVVNLPLHSI